MPGIGNEYGRKIVAIPFVDHTNNNLLLLSRDLQLSLPNKRLLRPNAFPGYSSSQARISVLSLRGYTGF